MQSVDCALHLYPIAHPVSNSLVFSHFTILATIAWQSSRKPAIGPKIDTQFPQTTSINSHSLLAKGNRLSGSTSRASVPGKLCNWPQIPSTDLGDITPFALMTLCQGTLPSWKCGLTSDENVGRCFKATPTCLSTSQYSRTISSDLFMPTLDNPLRIYLSMNHGVEACS